MSLALFELLAFIASVVSTGCYVAWTVHRDERSKSRQEVATFGIRAFEFRGDEQCRF
jgi:hypothetical protein